MTDDEMSVEYLYEMIEKQKKSTFAQHSVDFFCRFMLRQHIIFVIIVTWQYLQQKRLKKIDYLVSGKIVQMTSLCKKGEIKGKVFGPCGDRRRGWGPNHTHRYRYQVILVC